MPKQVHIFLCAIALFAPVLRAAEPIRVMLLDGQSAGTYHAWRETTPVLKHELEEAGIFHVDVVTAPAAPGDFSAFKPDFTKYDVVFGEVRLERAEVTGRGGRGHHIHVENSRLLQLMLQHRSGFPPGVIRPRALAIEQHHADWLRRAQNRSEQRYGAEKDMDLFRHTEFILS